MRSVGQFVTLIREGPCEHGESGLENLLQSEAVWKMASVNTKYQEPTYYIGWPSWYTGLRVKSVVELTIERDCQAYRGVRDFL
jgi:hypothetical protein